MSKYWGITRMTAHPIISKFLLWGEMSWALMFLALLVACSGPTTREMPLSTVTLPSSTMPVRADTPTPDLATSPPLTPTARVFREGDCGATEVKGHLFFLRGNSTGQRNHASYYDLYVMDGNGCYPRFVLSEASGSPAWSADDKRLAIGCENNSFLCILDAKATLDTCVGLENEIGKCHPIILQKFELPSAIAGDQRMYNIAWSSDGSHIAVEGGSGTTPERSVYILTLTGEGTWKIFMRRLGEFNIALSPTDEQLAFSGLVFLNLKSGNVRGARGLCPEWSPDGENIAFVTISLDEEKEPYGIASINLESGNRKWLYAPILRDDKYYFPPHNFVIRDDGYYHRLLSWSPDEQYLAFVSEVAAGAQSHIFRLNIATGTLVNLTANIKEADAFYAPAWGP